MFGIDNRLVVADDGVHVQKAGCVEELLRTDGSFERDLLCRIKDRLAARPAKSFSGQHMIQSLASRLQARVAAREKVAHVRRDERVGQPAEGAFSFYVAQIGGAG